MKNTFGNLVKDMTMLRWIILTFGLSLVIGIAFGIISLVISTVTFLWNVRWIIILIFLVFVGLKLLKK